MLDEASPILAADTVVAFGGELLGKPDDGSEATRMLRLLRGRTHDVVTGVAVMPAGKRSAIIRQPTTGVRMRVYSDADIAASIERGDPFDKAGAYAIQDGLLRPVAAWDGCYCNVVGLSLWAAIEALGKAGIAVDVDRVNFLPECADCPLSRV
jgi:MAF protein